MKEAPPWPSPHLLFFLGFARRGRPDYRAWLLWSRLKVDRVGSREPATPRPAPGLPEASRLLEPLG